MSAFALAAAFSNKDQASKVYFDIREHILVPRKKDSDVAVFLWLERADRTWRVTVMGTPPPSDILAKLTKALAVGNKIDLSQEEDAYFQAQKEAAAARQPWIEKQYFTSEDSR